MPPSLLDERGSRNDPGTGAREYATHHTFVLALLVTVAQTVLAAAGDSNKWVGGLHALDGMVILLLSVWLAVTAWRRTRAR